MNAFLNGSLGVVLGVIVLLSALWLVKARKEKKRE
mgnify:FL=1